VIIRQIEISSLTHTGGNTYSCQIAFTLRESLTSPEKVEFKLTQMVVKNRRGADHLDWPSKTRLWSKVSNFWTLHGLGDEEFDSLLLKIEGAVNRAIRDRQKA